MKSKLGLILIPLITEKAVGLIHTHGRPSLKNLGFSGLGGGDIVVYESLSKLHGRPIKGCYL